MSIEPDAEKDLALDDEDAANVLGGTQKKHAKKVVHKAAPAAAPAANPGLGLGPDPDYPNPDGGDQDC
jgi:hypothetical protein